MLEQAKLTDEQIVLLHQTAASIGATADELEAITMHGTSADYARGYLTRLVESNDTTLLLLTFHMSRLVSKVLTR